MKKYKTINLLLALCVSIFFTACVDDNNFKVPQNLGVEENLKLNSLLDSVQNNQLELKSIKDLKSLYISGNDPVKIVSDIIVKGYVISSDAKGNYFREFYMQDAPENPTAGIKITINLNNSYNKFNFGREIYIRLKGLYIGETNSGDGVVSIGGKVSATDQKEVQSVSSRQIDTHFFRSENTEIIIPKKVFLASLNASDIGTFITVNKVIFPSNLSGKAFVDPTEDFDTQRKIQTCQTVGYADLLIETSSFASFANEALPMGGGTINAVVSKDYNGNFLVLVLNSTDDVQMIGERCVTRSEADFKTVLLTEDFETLSGEIKITGWQNYREEGTKSWRSYSDTYSQSKAARIGSKNSNDASTITWLITKGVDLETTLEEFLSFETSNSFANGSNLEVLISANWDGTATNITLAKWDVLPAKIVSDGEGFKNWIHSTYVNLSKYSGTVFIAFKYTGTGNVNFDGTYELDNITIIAK
ncbi:DUF5689 domain-containing protein [Polaribacter glomeratus]|uniref:DUF5689 domain-containing protein n=1 Tax=Polaribacter glomeratus TaxID=102 RepID=A0A2S7WHG9_9FLAO|nr:DUF5689 domain-containing protein [Polaribacter glomeratus]PQJ77039.1 hypothetical protein BTO16_14395 [Polaribacter glomeratus]TXD67109.1 hypothetical protein ESX12_00520 [Polaribacter glomeratus]